MASVYSSSTNEMTAEMIRMITMMPVSCSQRIFQGLVTPRSTSSLGPYCSRRRADLFWGQAFFQVSAQFVGEVFDFQSVPVLHGCLHLVV